MIKCEICGLEIPEKNKFNRLAQHIIKHHNINTKEYYDLYFLKDINEKYCNNENCNNFSDFINLSKGYKQFCSNSCSSKYKEYFKKVQFDNIKENQKQGIEYIQNILDSKEDLNEIIYDKNLNGLKDKIINNYGKEPFNKTKSIIPNLELYKKILQRTIYLNINSRLTERLYHILNDIFKTIM